ncbi:hypothetical protein Desaci_2587 [Desulfosporosinus acidiphilus SJ4]|uniref:Uncharacterized protein n=1 Tax=Desulfosporosinus acidiphilus (strain DSM 22704 / JCM 16185 / SJ4) TaxID=646529 RepID=I4D6V0_DESAJ|nr:hypothetical protein [Desulfosporosinus acidiphilus]AFM41524.1 hypothetical protein Desaci_2587 [Desulfosporosinus acidiphilus SJ4]
MLNIRNAKTGESEILTNIAVRSEAYWGYDSSYMEKFQSIYKVTEELMDLALLQVHKPRNSI